MPVTHVVSLAKDQQLYTVTKNGDDHPAYILDRAPRTHELYVHYVGTDKRMDEWVSEEACRKASDPISQTDNPLSLASPASGPGLIEGATSSTATSTTMGNARMTRKRKRAGTIVGDAPAAVDGATTPVPSPAPAQAQDQSPSQGTSEVVATAAAEGAKEIVMSEEDFDIAHHKRITAQRNFDQVYAGKWQIKTWYFSPYPLTDTEIEDIPASSTNNSTPVPPNTHAHPRIPGVQKTTARSHGRTSDLLAGGLGRHSGAGGEKANLWVCRQCFKYMADANSYELHVKYCNLDFPPGRKMYQRGAHTIWEVDGAKNKLYCQNLSLFGKLFIDVKTLFFDCDNFLFYVLTDAESSRDLMIGFFSKEKISYDDYNLACIMTLPPYQKKGYGMLMIEFSYELSRRAGKVGTPERPLSDLGLRSYLAYWVGTLIRFFRQVLSCFPPGVTSITTVGAFPGVVGPFIPAPKPLLLRSRDSESGTVTMSRSGSGSGSGSVSGSVINGNGNENGNGNGLPKKKKYKTKGWAGEVDMDDDDPNYLHVVPVDDPLFTTDRIFETKIAPDGSGTTHVSIRCKLTDIARATHLRVEDVAFAMNECGLLIRRLAGDGGKGGSGLGEETVVVTRELVEKIAEERNVKPPYLKRNYLRL